MATKLHPECLFRTLFENTDKTRPCIIYMGVGAHCNDFKGWNYSTNQQLPAFLHDWKLNNPTIPVKIILFDQATTGDPYIIANKDSFFADSFIRDKRYNNVYNSEFDIQVYSFDMNVNWINDNFNMEGNYDITELICSIVKSVSESNHLFFFHEFTGRNPEILEYGIQKLINYDERRVCIDISRGRNLSCCVDFSEPENYPLIKLDGQYISWINPKLISLKKQRELTEKFENKSISVVECPYYNSDMFDYYLFKHIVNNNRYIYNICKQIIYVMRTLYNKDSEFSNWEATSIMKLNILSIKIPNIQIHLNKLYAGVYQIKDIIKDGMDKDTVYPYKLSLLEDLKAIIEICLSNIKYWEDDEFSELFIILDTLDDKCKLMDVFNDFCLEHNVSFK
jgi:hypothetical protein